MEWLFFLDLNVQKYNEVLGNVQHRVHEVMNAVQLERLTATG